MTNEVLEQVYGARPVNTFKDFSARYEMLERERYQLFGYQPRLSLTMQDLIDIFSVIKSAPFTKEKERAERIFKNSLDDEVYRFVERKAEGNNR